MRLTDFKYCSKCTQHKHQDDFAANVRSRSGKQPWCRACMSAHCATKRAKVGQTSRGCIEYLGRRVSLRQFAEMVGVSHYTVQDRWQRGERTIEQLSRKPPLRHFRSKAALPMETLCINSLLAGWKLPPSASDVATTQSASTA
jgi:hypothetical protein